MEIYNLLNKDSLKSQMQLFEKSILAEKVDMNTAQSKPLIKWDINNSTNHPVRIEIKNEPFLAKDDEEGKVIILQPHERSEIQIENTNAEGKFYIEMRFLDDAFFFSRYETIKLASNQESILKIIIRSFPADIWLWISQLKHL